MEKLSLKEFLQKTSPIVADGGISTSLYDKGFYINRSFEELSLTEAQSVRDVHRGFKRAGAQLLHTNTFGVVEPKLITYGLQDQLEEMIASACQLASEVAGQEAYVLGSIGPLGKVLEPLGPTSLQEAEDYFTRNVKAFAANQVEGLSFVGFHDLKELEAGLRAAKAWSQLPILASIGVQENMKTTYGHSLKEFVELCEGLEVDVIGLCGEVGPSGMLTALEKIRPLTKKPLMLLPNAGLPRFVNDQYIYLCNPDYMGKFAKRFVQAGADIVGGHCGVHEQHIQAITNALRMTQSLKPKSHPIPISIRDVVDEPQKPLEVGKRCELGRCLDSGEKVVSVELLPPHGVDFSKFLQHCQALQEGGVRFVNIPDGARAMARMSSLQLAAYVKSHFDLEPIPHFTTRDRNLIGLQSDLLGSHVNGVRNILVVTGDPPKLGNCPGATAVYDVDAIGLSHVIHRMNQGLDLGGSSFGRPTEFLIGVALNPTAANRELEIQRFRYKIEAGADFAITQPIYCLDAYKSFFAELGPVDIPIIMGIWPLVSLRNAEFLKNEVPGVDVPDWVIEEMRKVNGDKEEALRVGKQIAIDTMKAATDLVAGFQVSAPFNRVEVALEAIHAVQ